MAEAGTLLIRAGRLFPALDETVLKDGWVLVEDGRIAEVSASEPRADGARRIERPDATLVPGLIDCHVHLTVSGGGDWLLVRGALTRDVTAILADGGIPAVVQSGRLAVDRLGA